jgi:hypothetical protein
MTNYMILADLNAEQINGGCRPPRPSFPSISSISSSSVTNTVMIRQGNSATNVGLGLGGFGLATSFQGNSADVTNIIG